MNRIRQYLTPLTASALAVLVVFAPLFVFAAGDQDASFIQELVWKVLVAITGSLLYISGIVFDYSLNSFVIGFADYYTNSGVGFAVDRTWVTIRDFVNLFFIFGLVYIGFKMILDSDDSNTRRWLVNLIIAALLINFSLFITKFVVDFSNQISTQIAISGFGAQIDADGNAMGNGPAYKVDITNQILRLMGIASLFNISSGDAALRHASWGYIFGTAIMFLVTSFVLIAGGFILIIRFALLNLFMVLSPFMFIGWILPPLSNLTSKYWDMFLRRAFFAPIYFLFLYFSLEILKAFQTSIQLAGKYEPMAKTFGAAESSGVTLAATQSTIPFFILICIFLIASVVIAQKIGADGAGTAIKYGQMARQKLQRGVGASTAGMAGRLGRNTVGRAAYKYANSDEAKAKAARSTLGKFQLKAAQYGAGATFDARNVGGVGKKLNIGEGGGKGGFSKRVADAKKAEEKFTGKDGLGFVDVDKPENKARVEAEQKRIEDEAKKAKTLAEASKKEFEENLNGSVSAFTTSLASLTEEIEKSEKELEEGEKNGTLTTAEKERRQAELKGKKATLTQKETALGSLQRVQEKRDARQLALKKLEEYGGTDERVRTQYREELQNAQTALDNQEQSEKQSYDAQIKSASETIKAAPNEAKAAIKFERQRAYIEQKKRDQKLMRKIGVYGTPGGGAGLLGGYAASSVVGFLGGGALAFGATSAQAQGYVNEEVISELDEKYGKGGAKAIGKEKKKKNMEAIAEALNEEKKKEEKDDAESKDKEGDE